MAGLNDVQQLLWLAPNWVGFISSRNGERGLKLVNLVTQEPAQWVAMQEDEAGWYGIASPDGRHMALRFTSRESFTTDTEGRLVLVSLQEGSVRDLEATFIGFGSWSADSARYGFLNRQNRDSQRSWLYIHDLLTHQSRRVDCSRRR